MSAISTKISSVAHFIAKTVKNIVKAEAAAAVKIEASKDVVEKVSAVVAVATGHGLAVPAIVGLEDLGYALIGEIGDIFINGNAAQQQHLSDAGLDAKVIDALKAAVVGEKALVAAAKALKL